MGVITTHFSHAGRAQVLEEADSDPGCCMARKQNEGMLVCIIQGAIVLISRRRKPKSVAPDRLLP